MGIGVCLSVVRYGNETVVKFKSTFMTIFNQNTETLIGLFLILTSILTYLFPPKFGNVFYGVSTKLTVKNETVWAAGQKLFALSTFIIGLVFLLIGILNLLKDIPPFSMVLLLILLWNSSKYFIHKKLEKKFRGV